jgi:oligopeptide transport system substrate-binding protein
MDRIKIFFTGLLILVLSTSCNSFNQESKNSEHKQHLRTTLKMDPPSLDPRVGVDNISSGVIRTLFDGLTYMGRDGKTQLALAESYEISEDFKTYVFYIRKAKWSDGSPITAFDFESSWKHMVDPNTFAPNANLLYLIKNGRAIKLGEAPIDSLGVKALDDTTLVVNLDHSHATFLDALANCAFYPLHASMRNNKFNIKHYVGSGPFIFDSYQLQDKIVVSKNPHYWDAASVQLDKITFFIIKEESTSLLMFKKNEIDWLGSSFGGLSVDAIPSLLKTGLVNVTQAAGTNWLALNIKKFPFTNVNIRKALAFAINRKEIVDNVLHSQCKEALSYVPRIQKQDLWHPYFKDGDIEEAKRLLVKGLEELNITLEQFPAITIIYNHSDIWHKMMQAVQQQWTEALGIKVSIQGMDGSVFLNRLWKGDFEVARCAWNVQYNDPANILEVYKHKDFVNNHTSWEHPVFIAQLEAASKCLAKSRWAFLEEAEQILIDEMPAIPLSHNALMYIQKEGIRGVVASSLMIVDFRWASIQ